MPGGVLILSEKISMPTPTHETLFDQLHTLFKKQSGYSNLEISQKRKALEKVLIKDSEQQHLQRLESGGFRQVYRWLQCYNFISLLAVK